MTSLGKSSDYFGQRSTTTATLRDLTQNDAKILGPNVSRKLDKTVSAKKFQSRNFKTLMSAYTPLVHKPSNEQMFNERIDLVCNWFDLWNDSQRKRFLTAIFQHCRRSQLVFTQQYFHEHVPLNRTDFTKVLPRCLSLHIMSFLDPRSLSRASMVNWHWKFLGEQDVLWRPKCTNLGWYLPYEPAENEYGAWKKHYVACTSTLDVEIPPKDVVNSFADGRSKTTQVRQKGLSEEESTLVIVSRPDWLPPDKTPRDLQKSAQALLEDYNPNSPALHQSLTLAHNRFGISKSKLTFHRNTANLTRNDLRSSLKGSGYQAHSIRDHELRHSFPMSLSEKVRKENYEDRKLIELEAQPWEEPPRKVPVARSDEPFTSSVRPNLSGGGDYPVPWKHNTKHAVSRSFPSQENPRIIFISSRVPAAEVLLDAVSFGIIPLVYEYEGTTLESLLGRLDTCLQGRSARSIGFFTHTVTPSSDLHLVHRAVVNVDNLDTPEFMTFFETVTNSVLPTNRGGHVDIFAPVASSERGQEMLKQLQILTGLQFASPTGIIGQYNHIQSEWLPSPESTAPPDLYFCAPKLSVWTNTADQAQDACVATKRAMAKYFEQVHKDVVSQLTGQVVFDALGQVDIQGVNEVCHTLVDGLVSLGHQKNVKSVEFLGKYLLEKAGVYDHQFSLAMPKKQPEDTLAPTATMKPGAFSHQLSLTEKFEGSLPESEEVDSEVASINGRKKTKDEENKTKLESDEQDIPEIMENAQGDDVREKQDKEDPEKDELDQEELRSLISSVASDHEGLVGFGLETSRLAQTSKPPRRLTTEEFVSSPGKRALIGREILASEIDYMRTLSAIKSDFYAPLRAAVDSNRAIVSAQNVQIIFTDILALLELSKGLVHLLKSRLHDWTPDQCLGDIFVKFCTKLTAYTNFLNNYPIILHAIQRCVEQTPLFRAFLKRHEKQPNTKMLTLPELFLAPGRRVSEYVLLVTWFRTYTPEDHTDRKNLSSAMKSLLALDKLFQDIKDKGGREREVSLLQTSISKCPLLVEPNRFFLKQLDVAHFESPKNDVIPEFRVYRHVETLGLHLFNDSLMVTRRTAKNFPFERRVEHTYCFETCTALKRLRINDIPDSKYVRNAFRMFTPRREWICATDTFEEKLNWVTLLEQTIRAAVGLN